MKRLYHIANILLLAAIGAGGIDLWNKLPERIPVHFGFNGQPDRWTVKGWELILLLLLPLMMTVLFYGITALTRRYTWLLNVPDKEKLLALPAAAQEPFWNMLGEFLAALAASMNILILSLLYGMAQVALGKQAGLGWHFPASLVVLFLCILVYLPKLLNIVKVCVESPSSPAAPD